MAGAEPDVVIGCVGGGSNFAGLAFPFLADKAAGRDIRVVAAEPSACPTLTRGHYGYDFGDTAKMAPLLPMHTLGHGFVPPAIHSGGLRYHGMAPLVSHLVHSRASSRRAPTTRASASPRPSASPAARASSRRPSRRTRCARWSRRSSGRARRGSSARSSSTSAATGNFDLAAYDAYLAGELGRLRAAPGGARRGRRRARGPAEHPGLMRCSCARSPAGARPPSRPGWGARRRGVHRGLLRRSTGSRRASRSRRS